MAKRHSIEQLGQWAQENKMKKFWAIWPDNLKKHKQEERRKHFERTRRDRDDYSAR